METILSIAVPVVLGLIFLRLLFAPLKLLFKLALNSLTGFICLWLLNLVSGVTGVVFEINLFTTLIVGILGMPGIIMLLIKHFFL